MSTKVKWMLVILTLLGSLGLGWQTLSYTVYLPLVPNDPTVTPSNTPTPTQIGAPTVTPTPTSTPTATRTPTATPGKGPEIIKIYNPILGSPMYEYIDIKNTAYQSYDLTDWYIRDEGLNRYDFPPGFTLSRGRTVRLWTRSGTNSNTNLYWGLDFEVWNDYEDCAYLRDNSTGDKILRDYYCYAVNGVIFSPILK